MIGTEDFVVIVKMSSDKKVENHAPGGPGVESHWTSSAKCGVGTSAQPTSGVWFTLGRGIINEVYHPEIDHAAVRAARFLVTNGTDLFSDEADNADHRAEFLADCVAAYRLTNECDDYRIEKEVLSDPRLDVLLQRVRFTPKRMGHSVCTFFSSHIWAMVVRITRPGSTGCRTSRSFSRRAGSTHWHWRVRFRFSGARRGLLALRMAGKICGSTSA